MVEMLKEVVRSAFGRVGLNVTRGKPPDVRRELALYEKLYSAESLRKRKFYNVGAGAFFHKYWTNFDYVSEYYASVQKDVVHYDLMALAPLPIASGDAEIAYTSHTIEHVSEAAVENLFLEAHRVLKPGGCLRVTTGPDANLDYAALMRRDEAYFFWDEYYVDPGQYEQHFRKPATSVPLEERWLHHVATQLAPNDITDYPIKIDAAQVKKLLSEKPLEEVLDYLTGLCKFDPARPGNHMSWWTPEKAMNLMRKCGFESVYLSAYGQSRFAVLRDTRYFDNTHPAMSLYVEAVKA